jgi:hypothetical protein
MAAQETPTVEDVVSRLGLPTLDAIWEGFARDVLDPICASPLQRQEMKRAFYAGAAAVLAIQDVIGLPTTPEDVGVIMLEDLSRRVQRFFAALKAS